MGLSTLDIQLPGSGEGNGEGYKGISPGVHKARIIKVELWERPWKKEENALFLVLKLDTVKPNEDFVGYPIDDNNPDGEKFEGYAGNVKTNVYAYKDGMNPRTGKEIFRDREILMAILGICTELGIENWFRAANNKYETIEQWVEAFNNDKPYAGRYMEFCIAAEEYIGKDGKTRKTLFLPKLEKVNNEWHVPYRSLTSTKKLIQYREADHFKKATPKPVTEFSSSESIDLDFDLSPGELDAAFDM